MNNEPNLITLDYNMDVSEIFPDDKFRYNVQIKLFSRRIALFNFLSPNFRFSHFRLSYYPHKLEAFSSLLKSVFGPGANHKVYADFKPLDEEPAPAFYIHVIEKVWLAMVAHFLFFYLFFLEEVFFYVIWYSFYLFVHLH